MRASIINAEQFENNQRVDEEYLYMYYLQYSTVQYSTVQYSSSTSSETKRGTQRARVLYSTMYRVEISYNVRCPLA